MTRSLVRFWRNSGWILKHFWVDYKIDSSSGGDFSGLFLVHQNESDEGIFQGKEMNMMRESDRESSAHIPTQLCNFK